MLTKNAPVEMYASRSIAYIRPQATLREVARHLAEEDVGALVVEAHGSIAGVVSERDVARALAEGADPDREWADDVLSDGLVAVGPDANVFDVGRRMLQEGVRHVLVMKDGELRGVVSMRDIVDALTHD